MIFILAAALGLLVAVIRGFPLARVAAVRFRGLALLVPALGLHLLLNPAFLPADLSHRLVVPPLPGLPPLGSLLYLAAQVFAVAFLFANRRIPGFPLIMAGLALNVLAMAANGGTMPGLERPAQIAGHFTPFTDLTADARLAFLTDVIPVPTPPIGRSLVSVGDLVSALGVIAFFNPPKAREALTSGV